MSGKRIAVGVVCACAALAVAGLMLLHPWGAGGEVGADGGPEPAATAPGTSSSDRAPGVAYTWEDLERAEEQGLELAFPEFIEVPEHEEPETYVDEETGEVVIKGTVSAYFYKEVGEERMREIVAELGCEVEYITPQKAWQYLETVAVDMRVPDGVSGEEVVAALRAMPEVREACRSTVAGSLAEGGADPSPQTNWGVNLPRFR